MAHHIHLLVMTGDRPTLRDRPVVTRTVAERGYLRLWWPEKPPTPPAAPVAESAAVANAMSGVELLSAFLADQTNPHVNREINRRLHGGRQ